MLTNNSINDGVVGMRRLRGFRNTFGSLDIKRNELRTKIGDHKVDLTAH